MKIDPLTTPKTVESPPPAPNETWPAVITVAVVALAVVAVCAIVGVVIWRGDAGSIQILTSLITGLVLIIPATLAVIKSQQVGTKVAAVGAQIRENSEQTVALRIEMDGRFTSMFEMIQTAAFAEGRAAGSAAERQALADTLATQAAATALVLERAAAAAALVLSQAQTQAPAPQPVGPQEVVIANAGPVAVRETPPGG